MNDSLKQVTLNKILSISETVREQMIETYGIENYNRLTEIELDKYLKQAIIFLENELNSMGIRFIEPISTQEDCYTINLAITLRWVFSEKALLTALSADEQILQLVKDTLEGNHDQGRLINALVVAMNALLPFSTVWADLKSSTNLFYSTDKFCEYIVDLTTREFDITFTDIQKISNISLGVIQHVKQVKFVVGFLCEQKDVSCKIEDFDFTHYDVDVIRMPMDDVSKYMIKNTHPLFTDEGIDTPFIKSHKQNQDHHYEYYISRGLETATEKQIIQLVAEYCVKEWGAELRKTTSYTLLSATPFSQELKDKIMHYVELCANINIGD